MNADLLREGRNAVARGWKITPLQGKVPFLKDWPNLPTATADDVYRWVEAGYNLGVVTGKASKTIVLDEDDVGIWSDLPSTITTITGSGKFHYYFGFVEGIGCPTGFDWGEVKGEGGMVVLPGSIHPETGEPYRWAEGLSPEEWVLEDLPEEVVEEIKGQSERPAVEFVFDDSKPAPRWAHAAINRELLKVKGLQDGERNVGINYGSFRIGQVLHHLTADQAEEIVQELLEEAATVADPGQTSQRRTADTVHRGLTAGQRKPRWPRIVPYDGPRPDAAAYLLIPGDHVDDNGEHIGVTPREFCQAVYSRLPPDHLFRLGADVGIIEDGAFQPISVDYLRILVPDHVALRAWVATKKDTHLMSRQLSKDLAGIFLSWLQHNAPKLRSVARHPVVVGGELVTNPGYADGIWLELGTGLEVITNRYGIRERLEEPFVDFPFESKADWANFVGFMLTPILRPSLRLAPAHYISAGAKGLGKSFVSDGVAGRILLGRSIGATQVPKSEDEVRKLLYAIVTTGASLIQLDNLPGRLDSASLASFLTSESLTDRGVFAKGVARLEHATSIVLNGANNEMTDELARRCVPIRLWSPYPDQSKRPPFQFPDIAQTVSERRPQLLGALVGAVQGWIEAGRPLSEKSMPSYEDWTRHVGGIVEWLGYPEWLSNRDAELAARLDPLEAAALELLRILAPLEEFTVKDALAAGEDLCDIDAPTAKGREIQMGRLLSAYLDRPTVSGTLRRRILKGYRVYRVEEGVVLT